MRRALDALYDGAAVLAALFMVALLVMVMLSILGRQLHFNLSGVDAYAGYMMAASGFLALAHTLKKGEHIRVTLVLASLHGGARRALEVWALFAAALLATLFAIYSSKLAWQSHTFHDISTGNDATPLWIRAVGRRLGRHAAVQRARRTRGARVEAQEVACAQKKCAAEGRLIVFIDESGLSRAGDRDHARDLTRPCSDSGGETLPAARRSRIRGASWLAHGVR